jgi:TP901 family phage tail tape measure protein
MSDKGEKVSGFKNLQVLLSADASNLKRGLAQASTAVKAFDSEVKAANVSQSALGMGLKVGLAAGAAAVAVGLGYSIVKAVEFDKAMRNVNSLSHLSEGAFASLEAQVVSMSTRLPQSAKVLAEGLYDIASSGFQGADGMKILESAAEAASAGLTTTAISAKAITGVINAYGLTAADAADVSDILFQTVNLGVVSFEELAGSIGDVLGSAAGAKVSIDQVGAAIATMTLAGIGGAEATTSLNNLITKIIQPSEALAGAYKKLGYENGATALKTKGLHGVMKDIQDVTGGNITTLLEYFPEIRAARGALALMANEGKNYNKVATEIEDKDKRMGAMKRTLAEQMKGTSFQWDMLKNKVDAAAISLGVKMLPTITAGIGKVSEFGDSIGPVLTTLAPLGDAAIAVGNAIMALGIEVGPVVGAFAKLAGVMLVGGLVAFGKTLEFVANLVKDHTGIVMTLAIAYGVHLLAAMIAARGGMMYMAWTAIGATIAAVIGGVDALSASFYALATAEAVATLGIAAIIALGVVTWKGYQDGAQSAEDATTAVNDSMKSLDFEVIKKGAADGKKALQEMYDFAVAQKSKSFIAGVVDPGGNVKAMALIDNMGKVSDAVVAADAKVNKLRSNTLSYLMGTKLLPNGIQSTTEEIDAQVIPLLAKAKAAGVDLTGQFKDVKTGLDTYSIAAGKAGDEKRLIDAMGQMGDAATDTAEQVDGLKKSFDALLGIAMGADEAGDKFEGMLDKLTEGLIKNGKTLDEHTEKGRENKQLIRDSAQALLDKVIAEGKAGKSGAELAGIMSTGIAELYNHGKAAGFNKEAMANLLAEYKLTPALVSTIVEAVGAGKSESEVAALITKITGLEGKVVEAKAKGDWTEADRLQAEINKLTGKTVTVSMVTQHIVTGVSPANRAFGGIDINSFATGGARLPQAATVAKDGENLVQWAERGTGGEAFIPLAKSRRNRSTAILAKVADMFGLSLLDAENQVVKSFADGGTNKATWDFDHLATSQQISSISSRLNGTPRYSDTWLSLAQQLEGLKAKLKQEQDTAASDAKRRASAADSAAKDRARVAKDAADKRAQDVKDRAAAAQAAREAAAARIAAQQAAAATARSRARTLATSQGQAGTEGVAAYSSDASGLFGAVQTAKENRLRATAEYTASGTADAFDTADDYYRKQAVSAKEYIGGLNNQIAAQRVWGTNLAKIAATAGADVADSLAKMGDQGVDIVAAMSKATVADMSAMANAMRGMAFEKFVTTTGAEAKGKVAFQANLIALTKMGRGDLAAKFAEMGYDSAGEIAASAVHGWDSTKFDQLSSDLKSIDTADAEGMKQALKLAGLLQGSKGKLGIVGLSKVAGTGVADVLGVLETYSAQVFSKLGTSMAGVNTDMALINAGKQPTGMAAGGIVMGGHQKGLYYQWAEKGQGGESLIPLGQQQRSRARELWHETGRILGERPAGAMVSGGNVMIAEGAVKLDIKVNGANLTPAQLQSATQAAANQALASLTTRLRAGRR